MTYKRNAVRDITPDRIRITQAENLLDQAVNLLMAKMPPGQACSLINEVENFLADSVDSHETESRFINEE